jgi:hypothetical protein
MEPAGLEKMRPTPITDGDRVLIDLPDNGAPYDGRLDEEQKSNMNKLMLAGITKDIARRIVRGMKEDGTLLTRSVCSGVMLSYWFGSMEASARCQRRMLRLSADKNVAPEDQIYAASVGAQLAVAMVRTGEAMIEKAGEVVGRGGNGRSNNNPNTQVNVQFNLPPVAQPAPGAGSGPRV